MRQIKCKWLIGLLAIVLVCSLAASTSVWASEHKKYEWRMGLQWGWGADVSKYMKDQFAPFVKEKSKGRLNISVFAGGEIVPPADTVSALGSGVIEMAHIVGVYQAETPATKMDFGLPFGIKFNKAQEVHDFMTKSGIYDILVDEFNELNIHLLGIEVYPGNGFLFTNKPVKKLSDLKGMRLRATGDTATLLSELGVGTTFLPSIELYMAMKLGTIDGFVSAQTAFIDYKWYEVTKYVHIPPFQSHFLNETIVNKKAWNSLPKDLQGVLIAAHDKFQQDWVDYTERRVPEIYDGAKKLGYELVEWGPLFDEIRTMSVEKIWPKFAGKNARSAKIIKILKDYYKY